MPKIFCNFKFTLTTDLTLNVMNLVCFSHYKLHSEGKIGLHFRHIVTDIQYVIYIKCNSINQTVSARRLLNTQSLHYVSIYHIACILQKRFSRDYIKNVLPLEICNNLFRSLSIHHYTYVGITI